LDMMYEKKHRDGYPKIEQIQDYDGRFTFKAGQVKLRKMWS